MKSFLTLRSVDEVLSLIGEFPALSSETVSLAEALGRYLATDLAAPCDVPGFDRSTVDGYAVRARDVFGAQESSPALLECVGDCAMGKEPDCELSEGQTARILTGGMLPKGADAVVMVEYSRPVSDSMVEIIRSQAPGDHVIRHDEDAACGSTVLAQGCRLRPQEIGLLAALGLGQVAVRQKPRVAILSTGDEVVDIDRRPAPGQVRDVNRYTLTALCQSEGARVVSSCLVPDDKERLAKEVRLALAQADVILLSGGSSAGMRDFTVEVFKSLPQGEILVHGVALSPGKPFILARSQTTCLMGLPGHVSGALICAKIFVTAILKRLQAAKEAIEARVAAQLTRPIASAQGRRDYIRVRLLRQGQHWLAEPITGPSGLISGLVQADALVICPENSEGLYAGSEVWAYLLR
ncbi:MAG: molybdopterin molybdotransferase MoeA [Desulfovibrio sp.]|nr:molybdopterin molybdotransferase MoeA [Desulfovibrio sp.]